VKVIAGIVHTDLTQKLILLKKIKLDLQLMTYRVKIAITHHRVDIRYP
jgi:hypothetical protein